MRSFLRALDQQRWDDHRYYHHSRINQSLHLFSALTFLSSYVLLAMGRSVAAVLLGWLLAMLSRQVGHFFFEPKDYDEANGASHQHKEQIKVGYNLRRKVVLLSIWGLSPLVLLLQPTLFGLFEAPASRDAFLQNLSHLWLGIAGGGLLFRTSHLFFLKDVQTGLVWFAKILTDPFHDVALYYKAPLWVARGELLDPMDRSAEQV
jgi:hypothetical protein